MLNKKLIFGALLTLTLLGSSQVNAGTGGGFAGGLFTGGALGTIVGSSLNNNCDHSECRFRYNRLRRKYDRALERIDSLESRF
jgi:hypothetical protein